MTSLTYSANVSFSPRILGMMMNDVFPVEFLDVANNINWGLETPAWANSILFQARDQLAHRFKIEKQFYEKYGDNKEKINKYIEESSSVTHAFSGTKQFDSKRQFNLTVTMYEAGWRQWSSKVQTKSKEECAELGIRFRTRCYDCHFWVNPEKTQFVLGKLKLDGEGKNKKFIPDEDPDQHKIDRDNEYDPNDGAPLESIGK